MYYYNKQEKKVAEITFDDQKESSNLSSCLFDKTNYKAVVSLEDEICIFPSEVHDNICNYIAKTLARLRRCWCRRKILEELKCLKDCILEWATLNVVYFCRTIKTIKGI